MSYIPDLKDFVPLILLKPTKKMVSGLETKVFPKLEEGELFQGSVKFYNLPFNKDKKLNDLAVIADTATVNTWFNPEIKSDCRVAFANTGAIFDIIGEPENINQRSQFMSFKLRRIKGGA